jgi:hypothetical protein
VGAQRENFLNLPALKEGFTLGSTDLPATNELAWRTECDTTLPIPLTGGVAGLESDLVARWLYGFCANAANGRSRSESFGDTAQPADPQSRHRYDAGDMADNLPTA